MQLEPVIISTGDVVDKNRDEIIREYYGKIAMQMEITPHSDGPASIAATSFILPGVTATHGVTSSITGIRTRAMQADGNSDIFISFPQNGMLLGEAGRDDNFVRPGDMVLSAMDRMTSLFVPQERNMQLSLQIPRAALTPLVSNIDDRLVGSLAGQNPIVPLLRSYVANLFGEHAPPVQLREVAAKHLIELVALAIGANEDGRAQAVDGGVRGARLAAAKKIIMENIDDPDLSVSFVATRLGISPRYLHILFDTEGFTLSAFVTQQRLRRALEVLNDPSQHRRKIIDIAFDAGFNDLRTFNRAFRKCYDKTPTEARFEALRVSRD